jgi:hypothetical protein
MNFMRPGVNSFTYSRGTAWHDVPDNSTETDIMTNTEYKQNASQRDPFAAAGRSERPGELMGSSFDLRDTLGETMVREASFAEFLAVLRQTGRSLA